MDNYTIALDYFAASVSIDAEPLGKKLAAFYGGCVRLARPKNGYTFGYGIEVGDTVVAEFHVRDGDNPWCFAAGCYAQDLQDFCQSLAFGFEVTRMDAALDVWDAQWFPVLVDHAKQWASLHGIRTEPRGDWMNPERGRTFYLGARSSRFFHRIYEKGRQTRTDPNWIRCELEYKPQSKHERQSAGMLSASQLWAMHAGPIFAHCLGLDLEVVFATPVHKPERVRRDVERSRAALCAQYGRVISTWLQECGGDAVQLVAEIMTGVDHQASVRKWAAGPAVSMPELENPNA